ncbi:glycosyltransferase [Janthinobacterium fluminis]|uniref:Glycosyltransferase n=1 Tax=Janthinobacterium fluminis TaxID=2987524 RepID=A0ABT5JXZ9_9BURK|nr:glycosyltransferase [Janthinobacterium fluminis]MDC8757613.1 glycosyltransferase [Janthinobacterium fluminis]
MPPDSLNILQLVPEPVPTFRADVAVLFGKYLPRHAVQCDLVGMASAQALEQPGFVSLRRGRYFQNRWLRELSFIGAATAALLGARKSRCDVIQVRDMVPTGLLALLIARAKGIPFCYWVSYLMSEGRIERSRQTLARQPRWRDRLVLLKGLVEQAILYRIVLPRAQHVFVQSEAMLEHMRARGIAAARMTAVPMGVDMELLANRTVTPTRPAGWETVPLLAYLGTLDQARQLERVVDALAIVRRSVPDARLLLIGASSTPQDVTNLLAYVAAAGLSEAVRVTGWLPSAEAWALLAGADAAVSYVPRGALYDVSSPTKLLEYLALAMPAVGNDIPDQVTVLTESQAGWLAGSTPDQLAQHLLAILADPDAARRRAAAGPAYIEAARSYRVLAQQVAARYRLIAAPPA